MTTTSPTSPPHGRSKGKLIAILIAILLVIAGAAYGFHRYTAAANITKACDQATETYGAAQDKLAQETAKLKEAVDEANAETAHGFADTDTGAQLLKEAQSHLDNANDLAPECKSKATAEEITATAATLDEQTSKVATLTEKLHTATSEHTIKVVSDDYTQALKDNSNARENAKKVIERATKTEKYGGTDEQAKLVAELNKLITVELENDMKIADVAAAREVGETTTPKVVENTKAIGEAKDKLSASIDAHEKKLAEEKKAAEEKAAAQKAAQQNAPKRGNGSYQAPAPKRGGTVAPAPKYNKGGNKYHKPAPARPAPKPARPAPAKPKPAPAKPAPAPQKPGHDFGGPVPGGPSNENYTCEEGKVIYQTVGDVTSKATCIGGKWVWSKP